MAAYFHTVDWSPIIQEVLTWSDVLKGQIYAIVQSLSENPTGANLGVRVMKLGTHPPGGWYSAPFDKALLIFERMADHPHIRLDHVTWLNGAPPA